MHSTYVVTGRDEDVLVMHGWCDAQAAEELVGVDGRIHDVTRYGEGITGLLRML